jgi:flagellar biogenesis protein FliO
VIGTTRPARLAATRAALLAAVFAVLPVGPAQAEEPPASARTAQAEEPPASARTAKAEEPPARAAAPAQPIPYRKDESVGAMALDVAGVLGVSLAVGVGALVLLRRYLVRTQGAPGRRLRVVETVRLTPKSALYLVELDRRTLLIGQQGDSLVVLAPAAPPDDPAAGRPLPPEPRAPAPRDDHAA